MDHGNETSQPRTVTLGMPPRPNLTEAEVQESEARLRMPDSRFFQVNRTRRHRVRFATKAEIDGMHESTQAESRGEPLKQTEEAGGTVAEAP